MNLWTLNSLSPHTIVKSECLPVARKLGESASCECTFDLKGFTSMVLGWAGGREDRGPQDMRERML